MTLKSSPFDFDLFRDILEETANILAVVLQELIKNIDEKNMAKHGSKELPVIDKHHFLKCNLCTTKYKNVSDLERHIKSVHENHEKFDCRNCNTSFVTKWRLEKHIKMHYKLHLKECYY